MRNGELRVHPWCECVNDRDATTLPIFHLLVMIAKGGDRHICAAAAENFADARRHRVRSK
jgi:hypothetical protein